jgi:hypothetical protein
MDNDDYPLKGLGQRIIFSPLIKIDDDNRVVHVAKRRRDQHAHNSALAARFLARFECRRQSSEPTG